MTPNQIRLLHNGAPVDMGKRPSTMVDRIAPGNYAVSLLNLRVSDSGRYQYEIEGAPAPKHLVTIYVEPQLPKEKLLHLSKTTFHVGESVLFQVEFDENNPSNETPQWYRNEVLIPLNTSQRHRQTVDIVNRTHQFEISNLQLDDGGIYNMRTSNLSVETPEIKIVPKPVPRPVEEEVQEQIRRQSSVTIDMNRNKEQPL